MKATRGGLAIFFCVGDRKEGAEMIVNAETDGFAFLVCYLLNLEQLGIAGERGGFVILPLAFQGRGAGTLVIAFITQKIYVRLYCRLNIHGNSGI